MDCTNQGYGLYSTALKKLLKYRYINSLCYLDTTGEEYWLVDSPVIAEFVLNKNSNFPKHSKNWDLNIPQLTVSTEDIEVVRVNISVATQPVKVTAPTNEEVLNTVFSTQFKNLNNDLSSDILHYNFEDLARYLYLIKNQ